MSTIDDEEGWRGDQFHSKTQTPGHAAAMRQRACQLITGLLQVQQAHHISHNKVPLQSSMALRSIPKIVRHKPEIIASQTAHCLTTKPYLYAKLPQKASSRYWAERMQARYCGSR